jgi:hypothetical protein
MWGELTYGDNSAAKQEARVSVAGACGQPRNETQHTRLVDRIEKPNRRGAPPAVGKGYGHRTLSIAFTCLWARC